MPKANSDLRSVPKTLAEVFNSPSSGAVSKRRRSVDRKAGEAPAPRILASSASTTPSASTSASLKSSKDKTTPNNKAKYAAWEGVPKGSAERVKKSSGVDEKRRAAKALKAVAEDQKYQDFIAKQKVKFANISKQELATE